MNMKNLTAVLSFLQDLKGLIMTDKYERMNQTVITCCRVIIFVKNFGHVDEAHKVNKCLLVFPFFFQLYSA